MLLRLLYLSALLVCVTASPLTAVLRVDLSQAVLDVEISKVDILELEAANAGTSNSDAYDCTNWCPTAALLAARTAVLHARVDLSQALLAARTSDVESLKAALQNATSEEGDSFRAEVQAALANRTSEVESLEAVLHARVELLQAARDTRTSEVESLEAELDAGTSNSDDVESGTSNSDDVESLEAKLLAARTARVDSLDPVLAAQTARVDFLQAELLAVLARGKSLEAELDAGTSEEVESLEAKLLAIAARTARVDLFQIALAERTSEVKSLEAAIDAGKSNSGTSWHYKLQHARETRVGLLKAVLDTRTSEVKSLQAARGNLTCGEVKLSYNASGCCKSVGGQPENRFTFVDGR